MFSKQFLFSNPLMLDHPKALFSNQWMQRAVLIVSAVFFAFTIWAALSRVSEIHYSGVFQGAVNSKTLGGDSSLKMHFKPHVSRLERMSIFPHAGMVEGGFVVPVPFRLYKDETEELVFSGDFIRGTEISIDRGFHVSMAGLNLERDAFYRLELSMPDVGKEKGYSFLLCRPPNELGSRVDDQGKEYEGFVLEYMLFSKPLIFPLGIVVFGFCLLVCVGLGSKGLGRLVLISIIALGLGYLLGVYTWQSRVWLYFNEYWPDSYPDMVLRFMDWFSGRISFEEMHEQILIQRIGQAWFLPFILAIFCFAGLPMAWGYSLISGISVSLGVIAIVWYLYKNTNEMAAMMGALLLPFHVLIIRGMGAMQTDGHGFLWSALFIVFYLCYLKAESLKKSVFFGGLCVVCLFFGSMTRVALLPGLLVPVTVGIWSLFFMQQLSWKRAVSYMLPGILGAVLVFTFWHYSGLLESFFNQWDHSRQSEFTANYSWRIQLHVMLVGMQGAVIAIVPGIRMLMKDIRHVAIVAYLFGLQLFFTVGGIPPLNRYWISVAGIGILYGLLVSYELKISPRILKLATGVLLFGNALYLFNYTNS